MFISSFMQSPYSISQNSKTQAASNPMPAPATAETPLPQPAAASNAASYDFTNLTRREADTTFKQMFQEGKVTLDELFALENTGGFRIEAGGKICRAVDDRPDEKVDFIQEMRTAISNLEETGHAYQDKSPYKMYQGLLAKLQSLQYSQQGLNVLV